MIVDKILKGFNNIMDCYGFIKVLIVCFFFEFLNLNFLNNEYGFKYKYIIYFVDYDSFFWNLI